MASFGESLKRERELREISLRQISEATKINLRYLEALEENRFDALPGGLFNKGFIRAYCTYIGIDSEAMVNSYLQEVTARQPGIEAVPSRGTSNLHRPQEVPQRRATSRTWAEREPGTALSLTQRRAQETRASSIVSEPNTPAHAPIQGEARATLAALERVLDRDSRPAVTGIEVADPEAPASSRVLVWVLSLVAAAGVLFLIVSLARGTMPGTRRPPERPAASEDKGPAAPGGGAEHPPSETGNAPGTPDSSAVVPDISSQSPLMLGAAGGAPAPSPTPMPSSGSSPRTPPVKRPPLPPPAAAPAEEPPAENVREDHNREERGPMKTVVEARGRTYVILACDGREVLNRVLEAGETERAKCATVVRVSASDAGAVLLSVNGDTCLPLGDPGTRAYGYTIRIDDYDRICPTSRGGTDVRR
jgi:helix-turn-helix protein